MNEFQSLTSSLVSLLSVVESDIEALRVQNPKLKILASLGGEAVKSATFSNFITDLESLNNLTSSINSYYRNGLLDGVELDWEWPFQEGGKKDRIKLIRYARVRGSSFFNPVKRLIFVNSREFAYQLINEE